MRTITVKALWAFADLLRIIEGGLICLASKAGESKSW